MHPELLSIQHQTNPTQKQPANSQEPRRTQVRAYLAGSTQRAGCSCGQSNVLIQIKGINPKAMLGVAHE